MACSVECLNFFEDCYKSPNKSLYAELPNSLILKIIQEADGGKYTHKQRLKQVHQEMKDILSRSMSNYQEGVEVEEECEWRPINKSSHSGQFWAGYRGPAGLPTGPMMVNVEWTDIYDFMFYDDFWDTHSERMVQDSIISLWCLGDDLSVFGRVGGNEDYTKSMRSCDTWADMCSDGVFEGEGFIIYNNPNDCHRYALQ